MTHLGTKRTRFDETRFDYPLPRQNVLLLSCMDLRLINELVAFMDRDNLTNRYDHFVLAGGSLGVLQPRYAAWRAAFFEHVGIALKLHKPQDVYIVEHRNCGAYCEFLGMDFGDSPDEQEREKIVHRDHAFQLSREIAAWCQDQPPVDGRPVQLNVRCFLMDLRGNIELLEPPPERRTPVKRKTRSSSRRATQHD